MVKNKGQIVIAFRPEAEQSGIEKLLEQYQHVKIFPDIEYDPSTGRREQILARSYMLYVPKEKEAETAKELKDKYVGSLLERAYTPPQRKAMK